VPVPILAAWAGHADGGALAMRTYVKPNAEHLRGASEALAQPLGWPQLKSECETFGLTAGWIATL
jgi:hypothetical protein